MEPVPQQHLETRNFQHETISDLLHLGALTAKPVALPGGETLVFVPKGYDAKLYADPDKEPARIKRHPTFVLPASFIEYVNEFKLAGHSRVFLDKDTWKALAIIDWDGMADAVEGQVEKAEPRNGVHRATLDIRRSKAFTKWMDFTGAFEESPKHHNQEDFAEFFEEHALDIVEPNSGKIAELLAKILDIKVEARSSFKRSVRLQDGSTQFTYNHETDSGDVILPHSITIGIPILEGAKERDAIKFLMRYRLQGGRLLFYLVPLRLDDAIEQAVSDLVQRIHGETELPTYLGKLPS